MEYVPELLSFYFQEKEETDVYILLKLDDKSDVASVKVWGDATNYGRANFTSSIFSIPICTRHVSCSFKILDIGSVYKYIAL